MTADTLPTSATVNPWLTIWFSPRRTVRAIVDADVRPSLVPVIALVGLIYALSSLQLDPSDRTLSISRSMFPLVIGVLQLIFGILVGPFLLAFVGGWLGGEADPTDIRQAVAWSYVPFVTAAVIYLPPMLIMFGARAFDPEQLAPTGSFGFPVWQAVLVGLLGLLDVVALIWTVVLQVIMLACGGSQSGGRLRACSSCSFPCCYWRASGE